MPWNRPSRQPPKRRRRRSQGTPPRRPRRTKTPGSARQSAQQAAAAEAKEASRKSAAKPDAAAQDRVAALADEAAKLAAGETANAGAPLSEAAAKSRQAKAELAERKSSEAAKSQQATADALQRASEQLGKAAEQLARQENDHLQEMARRASELAKQTAKIESGATNALRSPAKVAAAGTEPPPKAANQASEAKAAQAEQDARRGMERAAANLEARQAQVERDKAIADRFGPIGHRTAAGTRRIAKQGEQLSELAKLAEATANAADTKDGKPANSDAKTPQQSAIAAPAVCDSARLAAACCMALGAQQLPRPLLRRIRHQSRAKAPPRRRSRKVLFSRRVVLACVGGESSAGAGAWRLRAGPSPEAFANASRSGTVGDFLLSRKTSAAPSPVARCAPAKLLHRALQACDGFRLGGGVGALLRRFSVAIGRLAIFVVGCVGVGFRELASQKVVRLCLAISSRACCCSVAQLAKASAMALSRSTCACRAARLAAARSMPRRASCSA